VVRPGRRISLLRAEMTGLDGTVFMYASAWMMRQDDSIVGPATSHDDRMPPLDDATPLPINFWGDRPEFGDVVDTRTAEGSPFSGNGRASMWARLTAPLLADRAWNPYARAITIADFPNGVASIEPIDRLVAINTDVSAYFGRAPQGEWIGLRSGTNSSGLGLGMTESLLYDASGFVGTANQSIFFDRVSPPGTTR
ncbi:MAG: thioesterase family protein, partial [Acidimicrobiia bacterium]|nr:thioesterase family protein [Acidimicrobiia bacterium]